jgi:hypothetical protein
MNERVKIAVRHTVEIKINQHHLLSIFTFTVRAILLVCRKIIKKSATNIHLT